MKKALLLLLFIGFFTTSLFAQLTDIENIVELPNTSKTEIYNRALAYVAKNFRSGKDVIQLQDKDAGKIIGKGSIKYDAPGFNPGTFYSGYFRFMIMVDCKDNKYKYSISQVSHESDHEGYSTNLYGGRKTKKKIVSAAQTSINNLAANFEEEMTKSYKQDNW
jgi:hypothetical protein